ARKTGGSEIACASVLKLVRMVQRIGKKISRPTAQAAAVLMTLRCCVTERAMTSSSRVQVLADHAHQEDGDDVGENDCIDTAGRTEADILAFENTLVDQVGQGSRAERALRGDENLRKDRQQEDRLDQDDHGDGAAEM